MQGNTVNNVFIENIQDYGGDAVIHQLCVKSAETLPICGGETWQGMPTNDNSNANIVAHSGFNTVGNVEDSLSGGEDPDLFSNANLRQEVSSNVNRTVKSKSVDFFIIGPFHNEKTGRSVWSIVLCDSRKSWALKDTFVQSYLQTLLLKKEKSKPSDINIFPSANPSTKLTFVTMNLGKKVSGVASPLLGENQVKSCSVCCLPMDALHPMLQRE